MLLNHSEPALLGPLPRILGLPLQKGENGVLAADPGALGRLIPKQGLGVVLVECEVERAGAGEFQWPE